MANYLKPQTPIELGNNYIYPLTTADQVIIGNGNRLNSLFRKHIKESYTLLSNNWSDTLPYTQTINTIVSTDDYNVDANIVYSGNGEEDIILNKAASYITYVKKKHKEITFYCLKNKPEIDIPIELNCTCRNTIATIEEGVKLNFDIKRYSSEEEMLADTPMENTIGVITDVEITGYKFSSTEPENMVEGEVWIKIGTESDVAFDIVNGAKIYPVSAKQYVGGVLVDVSAMSYKSGTFVPWITELYLYNNGDKCTAVTGGWTTKKDSSISVSVGSSTITFSYSSGSGRSAAAYTSKKIDTSKYTKMVVTGNMTAVDASEEERGFMFGLTSSNSSSDPSTWVCSKTHNSKGTFELTLDISNANSSYYACVYAHGSKVVVYTVSLK